MEKTTQRDRIKLVVEAKIREWAPQLGAAFQLRAMDPDSRSHIAEIGTSVLCTKWKVDYPGGSFVQAIVDNDLRESLGRADHINADAIKFYVMLLHNISPID